VPQIGSFYNSLLMQLNSFWGEDRAATEGVRTRETLGFLTSESCHSVQFESQAKLRSLRLKQNLAAAGVDPERPEEQLTKRFPLVATSRANTRNLFIRSGSWGVVQPESGCLGQVTSNHWLTWAMALRSSIK
jgi:hypothetical protein